MRPLISQLSLMLQCPNHRCIPNQSMCRCIFPGQISGIFIESLPRLNPHSCIPSSVKTFQPCRRLWRSAMQQSRVMAPLRTLGSRLAWKLKTTQLHATKCKIEKYKKHGGTLDKASSEIYIANMFAMNLSFADMSDDIFWNLWMFFYVLWVFVVFICTDGCCLGCLKKCVFMLFVGERSWTVRYA